jgi:glycosyltransferase involved in cell wall biosynthesis
MAYISQRENMPKPAVTVLMPAFNADRYISAAIESILDQTFKDLEFIICDDCSTDTTWQIIQDYAKKEKRIIPVKNDKNLGIAGNRNKLLSMAQGDYIVWQDADDISVPNRVELQYHFMEQRPEIGISGGWLQFFNEKGDSGIRKYAEDDKSIRSKIFRYSPVAQPAAIVRKKCLDEAGWYDLKYPLSEDLEMSFRIGKNYQFANISKVLIRYRENITSATFTNLKKMELNALEIRLKYASSGNYSMTFTDKIYNWLQYISIYIIPPKLKIRLFNLIRNTN